MAWCRADDRVAGAIGRPIVGCRPGILVSRRASAAVYAAPSGHQRIGHSPAVGNAGAIGATIPAAHGPPGSGALAPTNTDATAARDDADPAAGRSGHVRRRSPAGSGGAAPAGLLPAAWADGIFGRGTRDAIRRFQQRIGAEATGRLTAEAGQ